MHNSSVRVIRQAWLLLALLSISAHHPGYTQPAPPAPPAPVVTTVYIVRHAEKLNSTSDTPLSPAGVARAGKLAHALKDEGITAIFVTNFKRTQQTAKPLAVARGLTPIQYTDPQSAVTQILGSHAGGRILVVGHSNTVDDLARLLGASGVAELTEKQFDRLFAIEHTAGRAFLQRLRYGAETP